MTARIAQASSAPVPNRSTAEIQPSTSSQDATRPSAIAVSRPWE